MKCFISSSCSTKNHLPDVIKELVALGFRSIELTGNIRHSDDIEELILSQRDLFDLDLRIHNYLPINKDDIVMNISSCVPETHTKTLNIVHRAIDLSRRLGNDMYSLHPGFRHELLPKMVDGFFIKVIETENCNSRDNFYETVSHVSRNFLGNGFKIAVENLSPKNAQEVYSYLCTPDDIISFLKYFDDNSSIGLLLDLGHLNISAKIFNFDKYKTLDAIFDRYAGKIFEIHVSENDGSRDSHGVTAVNSWQIDFLKDRKNCLQNIPVVFEWQNCASVSTFKFYQSIKNVLETVS